MEQPSDPPADDSDEKIVTTEFLMLPDEDLRLLVEIAPLPAFVADPDDKVLFVNTAAGRFFGCNPEELVGRTITDLLAIDEPLRLAYVKQQLSNGSESDGSWEFLRKDDTSVWGDICWRDLDSGRRLFFVNDTTKRKQAERSFLEAERKRWQSQRIEALGRLAGGIAHDFNNFLAVILLHIDILNLQLPADSPIRDRVNEIKEVSDSVAGTVRQLLAFGRKQPMTLSPVVLNHVITEFAQNFRSVVGEDIDVEIKLAPDLGFCFVDQDQIVQVLMILARNAKDAMPNGGMLRIETANIAIDKDASNKVQPGGSYIEILVADNGIGMDAITEDYIFEPFFSTKESDKGAGLALAMAYGIVKQSKGFIWVQSEVGRGTTFKIQFPRIDQSAAPTAKPQTESIQAENRTVLLVEDEEAVRRITAEFLTMSGYEVLEASSGLEALEIAQSYNNPIHLLLTDFLMPVMNGREVAEKMTNLHPEASVLFMSGNIENIVSEEERLSEKINFIGKPFSSSSLILKVDEILKT